MNDQERIQKASSYRDMMNMWAWSDFQSFLMRERESALEFGINADDQKEVQMNRGKVRQLDAIQAELGFILGAK